MSLTGLGAVVVPYYLSEEQGWELQVEELHRALESAKGICNPVALYVINPGNPSGTRNCTRMELIYAYLDFFKREYHMVAFMPCCLQVMFKAENRCKRWSGSSPRRSSSFWLMRWMSSIIFVYQGTINNPDVKKKKMWKLTLGFSMCSPPKVYQNCVYGEQSEFLSYKRVLSEMGHPLSDTVELASFHSVSKGLMGE